jgi:hypothetical protein
MDVTKLAVYSHQHEIWSITGSPHDKDLLITAYNTGIDELSIIVIIFKFFSFRDSLTLGTAFKGSLWKINEQTGKIEHLEKLGNVTGSIKRYCLQ